MKLIGTDTSLSYVTQLRLALLGLAIPGVILAWLGWHVLAESQYRVERGRIASDIYTALLVFDLQKASLRNWSFRRTLDQSAAPEQRLTILEGMKTQIALIGQKADLAAYLDRQRGKALAEPDERLALLPFLGDVVRKLELETGQFLREGTVGTTQMSDIDAEFDQLRGVPLADALKRALSVEALALDRERLQADESLAAARRLFLSAGGFGVIATFILALLLVHRLRQPLKQLEKGLGAYRDGDFSYRFERFRDTEFMNLGQQLNAMATEVELARNRAAENRVELEQMVATRTAELRSTLDELAASEGARQKLLADIGHELRTPVTIIRGEAQVALRMKSKESAPYRAALTSIVDVSRQMGHLIEDLLVLVRDPKAQPVIAMRDIRLMDALTPALEAARSIAAQRNVTLDAPDPVPDVVLWADADRLRQILVCLLDNALRYSHPGDTVTLTLPPPIAGNMVLQIEDQGIGIEPDDLHQIFDRGWRSRAAREHRPDGLGLGLGIARQLSEAQGGQLEIRHAREGLGTVAVLTLPVDVHANLKEVAWKSS